MLFGHAANDNTMIYAKCPWTAEQQINQKQAAGKQADRQQIGRGAEAAVAAERAKGQAKHHNTKKGKGRGEGRRRNVSHQFKAPFSSSILFYSLFSSKSKKRCVCVCSHFPISLCLFIFLFPRRSLFVLCSFFLLSYVE